MPERIRIDGDSSAPAHSTTSFAEIPSIDPSGLSTSTPVHRLPVDDQPANERVRANRQIRPHARRREIADGARHAQPTELVHRLRSRAERPRIVARRGSRGSRARAPTSRNAPCCGSSSSRRIPADRDRPCVAVIRRIAEIEIAFEPLERGQHAVPGPRAIAEARPLVVVLRHAAQRDGRVHRARSADHAAARERDAAPARRLVASAPNRDRGTSCCGCSRGRTACARCRDSPGRLRSAATLRFGSSDARAAIAQPELPAPTIRTSYSLLAAETELTHVHRTRSSRCR